jgi:hypothetical protein
MADQGIAAITVELTTHEDIQWEINLPGILAILKKYSISLPGQDNSIQWPQQDQEE